MWFHPDADLDARAAEMYDETPGRIKYWARKE